MVKVMRIMGTSVKRSCVRIAALSTPDPAAGHCRPPPSQRLLDSQAHLVQSLEGSLLLSPGSWCTHKVLFLPLKNLFP